MSHSTFTSIALELEETLSGLRLKHTNELQSDFRLEGALNFRDFGGYKTQSGNTVASAKLFRSDALDKLTESDQRLLEKVKLATVIDLRSLKESAMRPHNLGRNSAAKILSFPIDGSLTSDDVSVMKIISENPTAQGVTDAMLFAAAELTVRMVRHLPEIFNILLLESSYPLVIHCAAGKDHTGFLCALIQYALGIPKEKIDHDHDYELTELFCLPEEYQFLMLEQIKSRTGIVLGSDAATALKDVKKHYLQHALRVVTNKYGSVDAYLEKTGHLTNEKRTRLQQLLYI